MESRFCVLTSNTVAPGSGGLASASEPGGHNFLILLLPPRRFSLCFALSGSRFAPPPLLKKGGELDHAQFKQRNLRKPSTVENARCESILKSDVVESFCLPTPDAMSIRTSAKRPAAVVPT